MGWEEKESESVVIPTLQKYPWGKECHEAKRESKWHCISHNTLTIKLKQTKWVSNFQSSKNLPMLTMENYDKKCEGNVQIGHLLWDKGNTDQQSGCNGISLVQLS